MWYVYFVRCADNSLYCGITKDLEKRVEAHNTKKAGAKYTRSRRPVALVWSRTVKNRSEASRIESSLKKMNKSMKEKIVTNDINIKHFYTECEQS